MTETIDTGYRPREPQKEIHRAVKNNRFVVVTAHRRMGKTVSAINQLIHSALQCEKKNPRYALISPSYKQSKRVGWDYLLEYTRPLGAIANIAELRVDFMGRRINLYGADNPDALRGLYFDGVVIDEAADIRQSLFTDIIRPAIAEREGYVLWIGTPKGSNHFKTLRDKAELGKDGWKLLEFKATDTKLLPESELNAALKEMGPDKYAQEFLCSFSAPVEGSYYTSQILDLEDQNRFIDIPFDGLAKTYCAWDLGIGDSTSIWVAQQVGQETRLVDFIENHGVGLEFYVNWLKTHNYHTAEQLLPFDVEVRELGSGKSRKEILQETGLNINVVPRLSIEDGIQAVRRLLPYCWFDKEKTRDGVNALKNYRREYDDKKDVFFNKPIHDWSSHAADAFRYLAVGMNNLQTNWNEPISQEYKEYYV